MYNTILKNKFGKKGDKYKYPKKEIQSKNFFIP